MLSLQEIHYDTRAGGRELVEGARKLDDGAREALNDGGGEAAPDACGVDVPAGVPRVSSHFHDSLRGAHGRAKFLSSPSPEQALRRVWASKAGCMPDAFDGAFVGSYFAALREEDEQADELSEDEPLTEEALALFEATLRSG